MDPLKEWVTVQRAAEELCVSTSTLKRFLDSNSIPYVRTPGGHRRIERQQLEVAARLIRSTHADCIPNSLVPAEIVEFMMQADHESIIEYLWSSTKSYTRLVELIEDVFVPALWRVGDMWLRGEIETAQEKVCTATADLVLDGFLTRIPDPQDSDRVFLGATFPPSLDTLAIKAVAIGLRSIGVKPIVLGCSIDPEFIARAATLYDAEAIFVSHTHLDDIQHIVECHRYLVHHVPTGCRVIYGGGAMSPSSRRLIQNATYYESIAQMVASEVVHRQVL
jgi:MerR family transcriptional regulator, light-induced transcriptional regulator